MVPLKACLAALTVATLAAAQDVRPVLVYDFGCQARGAVRDLSGWGAHGMLQKPLDAAPCPTGRPAAVFDGRSSVTARAAAHLALREQLTVDVWLRYDTIETQGCVVDKQGEVYRIEVLPDGKVHFGLKGEETRVDLFGTGLRPGAWHRITGTFKRPELVLYLDGKEIARDNWPHAVDPGGPLYIGGKSGRYDLFKGAIAQVHIYSVARAPQPDDEARYLAKGGAAVDAELKLTRADGHITVDTGTLAVTVDEKQAGITGVRAGDKELVRGNRLAPLAATLMESSTYDGTRDVAPERMVDASWECDGVRVTQDAESVALTTAGRLLFAGGDRLDVGLTYRIAKGQRRVRAEVTVMPVGEFRNRFVRSVAFVQPLCLDRRKRVIMAGDQGVREDVRHVYDFHTHVRFLEQPDHNCWRHFFVDQDAPGCFTMWRSESWATSGLVGFRGTRAPGWMNVYDRNGGVTLAYRGVDKRAPKCLYVNADEGATGTIYLHSPTHPALAPSQDAAPSLFGRAHEMDWVFFAGEEAMEQPEKDLATAWGTDPAPETPESGLLGDPLRNPPLDQAMRMWSRDDAYPAALSPIVEGGFPLPRGAITRPDQVRLLAGASEIPLDTRVLAYWPDQSIKWLLLLFPLRQDPSVRAENGSGEGQKAPFTVTTRTATTSPAEYQIVFGRDVRKGTLGTGVKVTEGGDVVELDTGPLQVRLAKGQQWLPRACLNGRELVRADARPQAFVDFLRPGEAGYTTGTTHPTGQDDPGPVAITRLEVDERDGLRAVVRLEGLAQCSEPARIIIRAEVWAGRPFLKLTHTVEFLHADPRAAFVRRMGLHLPLALAPANTRCRAGGSRAGDSVTDADRLGLLQTSHLGFKVWRTKRGVRWPEAIDIGAQCRGWLCAGDDTAGVCLVQRDMWQEAPKELRYEGPDNALDVLYWPDSVPLMDCRRYSLYPHQGQGESTPADQRWVLDNYYANDPFKGVSKTHETWLVFHDAGVAPATLDAVASDIQSRPLVYAGWPWYAQTGVTMPLAPTDATAFGGTNAAVTNLAQWWLTHQRGWGWYGMWDYGDVQHHYRDGYGRIFSPDVLERILALPLEKQREVAPGNDYPAALDYFTQNDWAYDNGRWGWSNTEGLVNHFMSQMYLRTGARDTFFFVEANARHARDVDARHAGKWFGHGTRHGVQHWSDGNHEERQTTFTEQRFHYLLTGDPRTREWNRDLAENWYLKTPCSVHASHSGRSYGLLTRWEITGDPELGRVMRDYMRAMATPDGVAISTTVLFPEAKADGAPKELNGASMFFHTFGAMHAMLEYYYLTGDEAVAASLIRTADDALRQGPKAVGDMLRKTVAFAARHAADPKPYRDALAQWCAGPGHRYVFQQVTQNPKHWSGETSFLVGNVSGGLFWANDALYVLGALDREPALDAAATTEIQNLENRPRVPRSPWPRGSWQNEYDQPQFEEYFRDRLAPGR